jgi:hypothetical protein
MEIYQWKHIENRNSKGTLLQVDIKIQLREPKNKTLKKQTLHSEREREQAH